LDIRSYFQDHRAIGELEESFQVVRSSVIVKSWPSYDLLKTFMVGLSKVKLSGRWNCAIFVKSEIDFAFNWRSVIAKLLADYGKEICK
jgi:hypothetical protein